MERNIAALTFYSGIRSLTSADGPGVWSSAYIMARTGEEQYYIERAGGYRPKNWPQEGSPLYYRDKRTGEIKKGYVERVGNFKFWFRFDNHRVWLSKGVIGTRLFEWETDAVNYGKMEPD